MKQFILRFDAFLGQLTRAAAILAGLFILLTAFIIVYEIIMRGLFHAPTEWVLEISTYFIIMAGFLGLAVTFREQAHVRVDLLTDKLSGEMRRKVSLVLNFLAFFIFLIFMTESMDLVTASYSYNKLSPSILRFPLFIPQLALVLGSTLLLGEIFCRFCFDWLRISNTSTNTDTNTKDLSQEKEAEICP